MYFRSIGVLLWGKYIFNLDNDNDDLYFAFDVFDFIYKRTRKDYLDIIGFLTVNIFGVKKMKKLYTKFLADNNVIYDKHIKSKLYKKAIYSMGYSRISQFTIWTEDASILFIIFNLAKSFEYIIYKKE